MHKLQEDLDRAGLLLSSALNSYLDVCSSVRSYYQQANITGGVPRAFSAGISSQISLIATLCETKMKQAKSTLCQAVNSSSVIVPINSLFPEILTRIFHLVVGERPCGIKHNSGKSIKFPKYPDLLSHVCTYWRQVVMESSILWSHIDLVQFNFRSQAFRARAEAYVTRAGSSLLDMHIYEEEIHEEFDIGSMLDFLAAIAPRIRSLEYAIPDTIQAFNDLVIQRCLGNCNPGTFIELNLINHIRLAPSLPFIRAIGDPTNIARGLQLLVSRQDLETLLLPVTALRLDGIYFPWIHQAYHGLLELRLEYIFNSTPAARISASELVNILSHSPRLRILHFSLPITDLFRQAASILPVHLDDLEVLHVTARDRTPLGTIFELISPGSKPLRLSLKNLGSLSHLTPPICEGEVRNFISRSNVAELHMEGIHCAVFQSISEPLSLMPNLRALAITGYGACQSVAPDLLPDLNAHEALPVQLHLDTLYLIGGQARLSELEQLIGRHSVNHLVLWNCEVFEGYSAPIDQLQEKFSSVCRTVRCIGKDEPNPIGDWF